MFWETSTLFVLVGMNHYMVRIAHAMKQFRRPEYTGANRCMPCTVVNLLIAAAVAGLLAVLVPWLGVAVFVVFVGIIYFRGYLIPGTPTFTKRHLPPGVLRLFGKQPLGHSADRGQVSIEPGNTSTTGPLAATGIIQQTRTSDIDLAPDFRAEWRERIQTIREHTLEAEDVREMLDAEDVSRHGDQSFVVDGTTSVRWGSRAAFVADIAAASLLKERVTGWTEFEWDRQRSMLLGLRLCLDRCPSCDSAVDITESRVDPCCQKPHLMAQSVCADCGAALADAAVVDHGKDESIRLRLLQS
jgi:hypothetical protein